MCTDVAARGIDIPLAQHVIHFQFPSSVELYVHRVGRTARISESGDTLAIVGSEDYSYFQSVCKIMKIEPLSWEYEGEDSHSLEDYVKEVRAMESEEHQDFKANVNKSTMKRMVREAELSDSECEIDDRPKKKKEYIQQRPSYGRTVMTPERAAYLNFLVNK